MKAPGAHGQVQPDVVRLDRSMGAMQMQMQMDASHLSAGDAAYVAGHTNAQIRVGNMGVQPWMGAADDAVVLEQLRQEQQRMPGLHRQGIYKINKKGAMNLSAMNDVIAKLEKADFESLTSFFDTKKQWSRCGRQSSRRATGTRTRRAGAQVH